MNGPKPRIVEHASDVLEAFSSWFETWGLQVEPLSTGYLIKGGCGLFKAVHIGMETTPWVAKKMPCLIFRKGGRAVSNGREWLDPGEGWQHAFMLLRSLSRPPVSADRILSSFGPGSEMATRVLKRLSHLPEREAIDSYLAGVVAAIGERVSEDMSLSRFHIQPSGMPVDVYEAILREASSMETCCFYLEPGCREDLFAPLFEALRPGTSKRKRGERYTPKWVAGLTLEGVDDGGSLLDVACGTGTFLMEALARKRKRPLPCGVDRDPVAVAAARVNLCLALSSPGSSPEIPVIEADFLLDPLPWGKFECVVGNPPWINWENLSVDYRNKVSGLFRDYGLYTLTGFSARTGGGKKDLSMLFWQKAAQDYLLPGGHIAFVITQSVFQSKGAGEGFRGFCLSNGASLRVLGVHDLISTNPFGTSTIKAAVIQAQKGQETVYPVTYTLWKKTGKRLSRDLELGEALSRLRGEEMEASPIDTENRRSPWVISPRDARDTLRSVLGPSPYVAREGCNTLGANGVYWLRVLSREGDAWLVENLPEAGRKKLDQRQALVEASLVYPLARGRDVGRWSANPSGHILMVQDPEIRKGINEEVFRERFPLAYAFLEGFRGHLEARKGYHKFFGGESDAPFYSLYNVGQYTVAPYKVVWPYISEDFRASVLGPVMDKDLGPRPVVPDCKVVLVALEEDEAHYLSSVLNSTPARFAVESFTVNTQISVHVLNHICIPRYDPSLKVHGDLAALSKRAHESKGIDLEKELDALAGDLWALRPQEICTLKRKSQTGKARKKEGGGSVR